MFTSNAEQVARALEGFPKIIREQTEKAIRPLTLEVERRVKAVLVWNTGGGFGGKDTGTLQRSIHSDFSTSVHGDFVGQVTPGVDYAVPVERGSRPHWPPLDALVGWARRHGTTPYLVARGIALHGTKGIRMFEQAYSWLLEEAPKRVEHLGIEILTRLRWS